MNAQMPAVLAAMDQITRDRQERLLAEARSARLVRTVRAEQATSPRLINQSDVAVRQHVAGANGGTTR